VTSGYSDAGTEPGRTFSALSSTELLKNAQATASEAAALIRGFSKDDQGIQKVVEAGTLLARSLDTGGKIVTCGNGGSMCDAIHLAEELSGRFRATRRALAGLALSDPGYLTCVGNDMGYDEVFSRGIEALGRPGDVLVAFTTSGMSMNVIQAMLTARRLGMDTVAITGHDGRPVDNHATITIVTRGGPWADRIQELHSLVIHMLVEIVERCLGIGI